jgi:cobalt-zinc-cadmium efflux system outer membrane protein
MAASQNHDVRMAEFTRSSAAAAVVAADAPPNPVLSVQSVGINPNRGIGAGSLSSKTVDTTLGYSQLIERGGKRELRGRNARALEAASVSDLADTRRQQSLLVSAAYYDLAAAQEGEHIAAELQDFAEHALQAAERRLQAGDLAAAEVERIRIEALRARNDARQARSDRFKAQQTLALAVGADLEAASLLASDPWPDPEQAMSDNADSTAPASTAEFGAAIHTRPDVMAAQARLDAALAGRDLALAQRKVDVTVGVQLEHYPYTPANGLGSGNSIGVSLQVPLQSRYDYAGEIRSAELAVDAAREALAKTSELASNELASRSEDLRATREQSVRYHAELLPAAQRSAAASAFAFANGAASVTDWLDAQRTDRAIRLEAVAADAAFAKALAAWDISAELHRTLQSAQERQERQP